MIHVVIVATGRLVVGDGPGAGGVEGGIGPDGESVLTTTDLGASAITRTGEGTLVIIDLRTVDGVAAVADTIVLETSIAEAVTLALGNALLHRHLLLALTRPVDQSGRCAGIVEASNRDKGLKLVQTRRQLDVPGVGGLQEGNGRGSDDASKTRHVD